MALGGVTHNVVSRVSTLLYIRISSYLYQLLKTLLNTTVWRWVYSSRGSPYLCPRLIFDGWTANAHNMSARNNTVTVLTITLADLPFQFCGQIDLHMVWLFQRSQESARSGTAASEVIIVLFFTPCLLERVHFRPLQGMLREYSYQSKSIRQLFKNLRHIYAAWKYPSSP